MKLNKIRRIIPYIRLYGLYYGVLIAIGDLISNLLRMYNTPLYWVIICYMIIFGAKMLEHRLIILSPYEDKGENK